MDVELKDAITGIRTSVGGFDTRLGEMQRQVDAIDLKLSDRVGGGGGSPQDPLRKAFEESAEFNRLKELGKGRALVRIKDLSRIQTKTLISETSLGVGTAGVLAPERVGPIVPTAQRRLFMRDLLSRGNRVTGSTVYFIQEQGFVNAASPQASEGAYKAESADTFTTVSRPVVTLAHWIPASRQVLDDMPALLAFVQTKLLYGLRYIEDLQILSGSGTGQNLTGLIGSAAAFTPTLLNASSSWNRIDVLRRALQQVERVDEVPAGFLVLHPDDWANIELTKSTQGEYLVGDPRAALTPALWGRPVVVTTAIASGTFLAGSTQSAELLDRMDATVEISTEYSDYFVRNLCSILCECREVLCIYRPNAFISGTLVSSPM